MTLVFAGGGTLGSVTPLLAVSREMRKRYPQLRAVWIGTRHGPERGAVAGEPVEFHALVSAKLRRYFSFHTIITPFTLFFGFIQAVGLLFRIRPSAVVAAGSFVGVPTIWAAWVLRIPVIIHQPDVQPGLSLILTHQFAAAVTLGFSETAELFRTTRPMHVTGNPTLFPYLRAHAATSQVFFIEEGFRVCVIGGGTGAEFLNKLAQRLSLHCDSEIEVCLVSGKDKTITSVPSRFRQFERLSSQEMFKLISDADVVISRAGAMAIAEIAYCRKPAILIPLPSSPQEKNAEALDQSGAAVILRQDAQTEDAVCMKLRQLRQSEFRQEFSSALAQFSASDAARRIADIIHSSISTAQ